MSTVTLLSHTPDPERLVAAAAKLCYAGGSIGSLLSGLTPENSAAFVYKLLSMGHESPIEHISFTFGIEGVSRTLMAQITRHRMASFSVQSQRYVSEGNFGYVTPPAVAHSPEAAALFEGAMAAAQEAYDHIAKILTEEHTRQLVAQGQGEKKARAAAAKLANEDARFVLPGACETKMMVTMNARALINFFHHRLCLRAQWEIRAVALEMLMLVMPLAPSIFGHVGPPCVEGPCPEGAMCCGQLEAQREFYRALREDKPC